MKYSSVQYAQALRDLVRETPPAKRRGMIREFLATLAKNNGLSLLSEIVREYEALKRRERGIRAVTVRAPDRLSERGMARRLGFKARVKSERDARLMGGAIVESEGVRVDNSVARRLQRVRAALTE